MTTEPLSRRLLAIADHLTSAEDVATLAAAAEELDRLTDVAEARERRIRHLERLEVDLPDRHADDVRRAARELPDAGALAERLRDGMGLEESAGALEFLHGQAWDALHSLCLAIEARHRLKARVRELEQERDSWTTLTTAGPKPVFVAGSGGPSVIAAASAAIGQRVQGELERAGYYRSERRPTWLVSFIHGVESAPSPSAIVKAGPAGAVWRVLRIEQLPDEAQDCAACGGSGKAQEDPVVYCSPCDGTGRVMTNGHALELEPVDPHDVGPTTRVVELPLPIVALDATSPAILLPSWIPARQRTDAEEARAGLLARGWRRQGNTWTPPVLGDGDGSAEVEHELLEVAGIVRGDDGLFRETGGGLS